jgi:hypothetical protein
MPDLLTLLLDWGFLALSAGAIAVGALLTRGRVRLLILVALAMFLVQVAVSWLPLQVTVPTQMVVYSLARGVLTVGMTATLVAAAVIGARESRTQDARIAALTDQTPETWAQPEGSPDPRLLAE